MLPVATMFVLLGAPGLATPPTEALTGCLDKADNGFLYTDGERLTITDDLNFSKHVGLSVK